jgi:hypothetical protein
MTTYAYKAAQFGAEEAVETLTALALMDGRTDLITGYTSDMKDGWGKEAIQDGIGAAYNVFTQGIMVFEQQVLESAFNKFSAASAAIVLKSKVRLSGKLRGLRGRKAKLVSKVLGGFDKLDVDHARLVADYGAMSMQARGVINTPASQSQAMRMQQNSDSVELQKERVKLNIAGAAQNSMQNSFAMKMKLSSFTTADEKMIKAVTGMVNVTTEDIEKLNAISSNEVFRDSAGNWVGGVQVTSELMTGIALARVTS